VRCTSRTPMTRGALIRSEFEALVAKDAPAAQALLGELRELATGIRAVA